MLPVGYLDSDMVVFDHFARLLDQVGNVSTSCMGQELWLVHFEKLFLGDVPIPQIDIVIFQRLIPDNGFVPENHVEVILWALSQVVMVAALSILSMR
jgi:hypothetical protein